MAERGARDLTGRFDIGTDRVDDHRRDATVVERRRAARTNGHEDLTIVSRDVVDDERTGDVDERDGDRSPGPAPDRPHRTPRTSALQWVLGALVIVVPAVYLRVVALGALGFNSDEAVYAGQAASIAGQTQFLPYFPVFRAHPLLFQSLLSLPYQFGVSPLVGRLLSAALGLATVGVVYVAGVRLHSRRVGFVAALILAVMPYHVIVTRQVLLDGPTTFFATVGLYLLIRYADSDPEEHVQRLTWLAGAAAAMALSFLSKETSVLLMGGVYAFIALSPELRPRLRHLFAALVVYAAIISVYPVSLALSGRQSTGHSFLVWQLFRRANHSWTFYPTVLPSAMGVLVLLAVVFGLFQLRRRKTWRERLLLCWILVPFGFFQIWPVKGFQYLLPIAPAVAMLAALGLTVGVDLFALRRMRSSGQQITVVAVGATVLSLAVSSFLQVRPQAAGTEFLAGSGGVLGGREAGWWVRDNVPEGGRMLALGPSMANIIQFYGDRKVYGLSVSPNPLHRNPVYEPVYNPDYKLRNNDIHYLIWDSYSAGRSSFFSDKLQRYAERYNGRVVHTETVEVRTPAGEVVEKPAIIIYEVRP